MESESSMNQAIHLCRFCRKAVLRGVPGLLILCIIGIMLLCRVSRKRLRRQEHQ